MTTHWSKPRKRANNKQTAGSRGERRAQAKAETRASTQADRVVAFYSKYGLTPDEARAAAKMQAAERRAEKKNAVRGWRFRDWLAWRD